MQQKLPKQNLYQNLQYDICIPFDSEFSKGRSATNRASRKNEFVLFCHEEFCVATFHSVAELDDHMLNGLHDYLEEASCTEDKIVHMFIRKMRSSTIIQSSVV
jgi:hypothetical protein